eukprot:3112690-Rhodomonas_salina.2
MKGVLLGADAGKMRTRCDAMECDDEERRWLDAGSRTLKRRWRRASTRTPRRSVKDGAKSKTRHGNRVPNCIKECHGGPGSGVSSGAVPVYSHRNRRDHARTDASFWGPRGRRATLCWGSARSTTRSVSALASSWHALRWRMPAACCNKPKIQDRIGSDAGLGRAQAEQSLEALILADSGIAKLLLKNKADMNGPNPQGHTPLHLAREFNHLELADYLLSKGAVDRGSGKPTVV